MEPRHYIIISGTGRAGTTFLVQLLTALRLDTGFSDPWAQLEAGGPAALEHSLLSPDAPYIVKSPFICDYLDEVVTSGAVVIDHAIIPVRDLYSAAESRRSMSSRTPELPADRVPGGLWYTTDPEAQEDVLCRQLYKIVEAIAKHDIPLTLLHFPRLVQDAAYLYEKLAPVFPGLDLKAFAEAFGAMSRPELVHDFVNPAVAPTP